jgi:HK97 gp10 family phage protein
MAKCTAKLPEELLKKLSRVGSSMDAIANSALKAGGEVVLKKTKSNLQSMVKGPSTGQLVNALGLSPVLLDRNGDYNIKVGFDEYRADGSSNAMVANIIEYGKHGQPAKPFLKNAKISSKKECEETMARKIEEEIGKL